MPLRADVRARFNETAAQEHFFATEGDPYGYYNFLFGWIDTPEDNYPPLLPAYFAPIVFAMLDKIAPKYGDEFYNQALNYRMGTSGLRFEELVDLAADQGKTIEEIIAMPE